MGIIRSVLTADTDEIAAIRSALDAKSTGEPVIKELRATLSKPIPVWAMKIDDETALTVEALSSLEAALTARLTLLESYPEGAKRNTALERHHKAQEVVNRLQDTLAGVDRTGAHGEDNQGDHHDRGGEHSGAHNDVAVGVG